MLSFLPVSFETETSLSPKRLARKLDRDLVEHRPTIHIMSQGRFMRKYRLESCYYGCRTSSSEFRLFHHQAKKRDGGSTGFYGKIEATESGSRISGSFRKPAYTYVFGIVWTLVIAVLALFSVSLKEYAAAGCFGALWAVGVWFMFSDNKKPTLRAYLEALPKAAPTAAPEVTEEHNSK